MRARGLVLLVAVLSVFMVFSLVGCIDGLLPSGNGNNDNGNGAVVNPNGGSSGNGGNESVFELGDFVSEVTEARAQEIWDAWSETVMQFADLNTESLKVSD